MKNLFVLLLPPILFKIYRFFRFYKRRKYLNDPNTLFGGHDRLFKEIIEKVKVYGEYGCGKSTNWVLANTSANVLAVDTSDEWVNKVRSENIENNNRLNIHFSNLGEVGEWGYPESYDKTSSFSDYTDFLWRQIERPDIVLIDGRFRVCCFLTTLKFATEGTKIIFDDYVNRPKYHIVEKYIPRMREFGCQCLFIVPRKDQIDFKELESDISNFRYVMD